MNTKYHQTDGFKFNPAGLIGLDVGTAKGIAKHLRAREREINTIETIVIECQGGPFNGQSIELQPNGGIDSTPKSAEFTVGAWCGHYLGSQWVSTLEANAPAPEAIAAPLPRPRIVCDLPAKGFDQLRDLLGEMSINPLERETTIKTRYKTARFKYGKTDDFGNEIVEFSPVGAYRCEIVEFVNSKRSKKIKPSIVYKIIRAVSFQQGAMAMDDFGDLFITHPRATEREEMTEKRQFTTYKLGRTSYTIPATIEAVERLATKILKIKRFCNEKTLSLGGQPRPAAATQPAAQVAPMATAPALQPVATVIDTPPTLATIDLDEIRLDVAAATRRGIVYASEGRTMLSIISNREIIMASNLAATTPKNEQPAKPLATPPATTCNPEAARLRAKATICRQAKRPAWAKILEDKADALERVDPPEPPPCKHKRQRPHKTACILLAKIRHPVRQKYRPPGIEPPAIKSTEPPAIKTVTPSGNFYQTTSTTKTERLTPCPAHNLNPATRQPHPYKSKPSAVIYPCQPLPNFAASTWHHGKLGKLDDTACRHPFGGSSTSYWKTPSCRTTIKPSQSQLYRSTT